tara:strand:+ start:211 stop:657 length:447 start_codon:yes stop_codon:yes gene_type:complete
MKKQEITLITYHDNGQISEVKILNKEKNLIKKSSKYNRNGILTQQRDYIYFLENGLVQQTFTQYGAVSGGLQARNVTLGNGHPFDAQTLKEIWYEPAKKSSETEHKYFEPTKKKFAVLKEIKVLKYTNDSEGPTISRHAKFDRKGKEI